HEWCVGELRKQFRVHCHYFIVLKEIGRPLSEFRTTKELVTALRDALQAHTEAYRRGILHRDISIGNILINEDGGGLLIDWEFSKPIANPEVRVMARTGTWQFMSAHLLSNKPGTVEHTLVDDVESFFHVLCYVVLVHCRHTFPKQLLKSHLKSVYDAWFLEEEDNEEDEDDEDDVSDEDDKEGRDDEDDNDNNDNNDNKDNKDDKDNKNNKDNKEGEVVGGYAKRLALANSFMAKEAKLPKNNPLRDLVTALEDVIGVRYRDRPTEEEREAYKALLNINDVPNHVFKQQSVWRYDEAMRKLSESSQWMLDTFKKALEDPRGLRAKPVHRKYLPTNRKRIRETLKVMSNRGSTNQEDGGQAGGSGSKRKRTDVHGSESKKARKGGR
ncbi:other 1 protein kinase, partial [Moniliophthora roreri MCA 2997]